VSHQKYLFDTNLFIERFRRTPKVVRLFDELSPFQVTLSVVSYLEFVRGEVSAGRIKDTKTMADTVGSF
jgi:predicted nucleic acid-binding protein